MIAAMMSPAGHGREMDRKEQKNVDTSKQKQVFKMQTQASEVLPAVVVPLAAYLRR
jgi:hypothetical protein